MVHKGRYRKPQGFIGNVSCRKTDSTKKYLLVRIDRNPGGALETRSLEQCPDQTRKHESACTA